MRSGKAETAVQGSSFARSLVIFWHMGHCSQCAGGLWLLASPWHIGRGLILACGVVAMVAAQPVEWSLMNLAHKWGIVHLVINGQCSSGFSITLHLADEAKQGWWGQTRPKQLPKVRVLLEAWSFFDTHTHTHTLTWNKWRAVRAVEGSPAFHAKSWVSWFVWNQVYNLVSTYFSRHFSLCPTSFITLLCTSSVFVY